jgi:hypothetical protein
MQRRKDAWLPESDSAITEGCVDADASVSRIMVFGTVADAPAQAVVTFVDTAANASLPLMRACPAYTGPLTRTTETRLSL